LRTRVLDVPVEGLPKELDGLRVAHLSDFHLGVPSRGSHAVERAVEWAAAREPDLVCISGDLLSRPRGEPLLRRLLARLGPAFAVLGNHDLADSRDPFSKPVELGDLGRTELLLDEARVVESRGCRVQIVGVHPRSRWRASSVVAGLVDPSADLRIVLTHFPELIRAPTKPFELVLAGHMHGGQIVLPYPGGRFLFAHPTARESKGIYRAGRTTLHVSPGLGTTFVPFRFFARPEVTELVLRPA
jgi:predicted MPP superfamily phosphohydrolase